ncbi:MAG: MFS transporter [Phycisphaerae bacterium]
MLGQRTAQLGALAAGHLCVDSYAVMIWPMVLFFADRHGLSVAQASLLPVLTAVMTSFAQPVMGYWSDRGLPRQIALAGPAIAAAGIALAIPATSITLLVLSLAISGLGVAVYHPEAAVLAGDLLPQRRSLATGLFLFGGTLGLGLGPTLIPRANAFFGPRHSWLIAAPAILATVALLTAFARSKRRLDRLTRRVSLRDAFRGKGYSIALLVSINSLRGFSIAGVSMALTWLVKQRGGDEIRAGDLVSIFALSGGLGGLLCGLVAVRRLEKPLLIGTMIAAPPLIWMLPYLSDPILMPLLAVGGMLTSATVPVVVAISQRMVPAGARVASSLMMGLSWGIGGMTAPPIVGQIDRLEWAFVLAGLTMLPAALCAVLLPRALRPDPTPPTP